MMKPGQTSASEAGALAGRSAGAIATRVMIAVVLLAMVGVSAAADSIRVRRQATAADVDVQLRDVADLSGPIAVGLGDTVMATFTESQRQVTVTLDGIRQRLDQAPVHWGRLTLGGYTVCQVDYQPIAEPEPAPLPVTPVPSAKAPAEVHANPMDPVGIDDAVTVQARLLAWIEQWAGVSGDQLRVTFGDRDEQVLSRDAWYDRYEFVPLASGPLGRVPIGVHQYRGDELIRTDQVTADIVRHVAAVVIAKTVSRGQTLTDRDIEIRQVYAGSEIDELMTDPDRVVGQEAGAVLRAGTLIKAKHLRSPLLVRRGDLVTVRVIAGGLVIKTVARANENGARDDVIQVRNERSREFYTVRVTGSKQAMTVTGDGVVRPSQRMTSLSPREQGP